MAVATITRAVGIPAGGTAAAMVVEAISLAAIAMAIACSRNGNTSPNSNDSSNVRIGIVSDSR